MLFCDVHPDVPHPPEATDDPVWPGRPHRANPEAAPSYLRELDDVRNAFAQLSVDYLTAVDTATALRETLLRAEVRNRRCAQDERRERDTASLLRAQLDGERQRTAALAAERNEQTARIAAQADTLHDRATRIDDLQRHVRAAADRSEAQAVLLREYEARLNAQAEWGRGLAGELRRQPTHPKRAAWLLRLVPGTRPSCATQRT